MMSPWATRCSSTAGCRSPTVRDVTSAAPLGTTLLDTPIVLWRSPDGTVHAARDQCPHRGAALSLGQVRDDTLMCGYHGWVYDSGGHCVHQPASPGLTPPPKARLEMFDVCERYGVVFVALGDAPAAPPDYFPEWDEPGVRQYHDEPVVVHACGPRIVENFLDMAHFPFVHPGVLGAESHTEVRDYTVTDDRRRHRGHRLRVLATGGDARFHGRRRRGVPLPRAPPLRGHADQAPRAVTPPASR